MQPYGRSLATESTIQSEHQAVVKAFAAFDALVARIVQTGGQPDSITPVVIEAAGQVVRRADSH